MPSLDTDASARLTILKKAAVVPPNTEPDFAGHAGVFTSQGAFVEEANIWRAHARLLTPSHLPAPPPQHLPGRHLYAGQINRHFGHFICESLARLWALDHIHGPIDSLLYVPRRLGSQRAVKSSYLSVFRALGVEVPIRILDAPSTVDELIVPEQGFNGGILAEGTAAFRTYIQRHFLPDVAPDGPERLYITRENLLKSTGSILAEASLSQLLAENGYEIFAPEKHDLATQIARFRAAKQIVAVEGTALHLFGFVGHSAQKVAIIARRSDLVTSQSLARQLYGFCAITPTLIDKIAREWDVKDQGHRSSRSMAAVDLGAIKAELRAAGFIDDSSWQPPQLDVDRMIARHSRRTKRPYVEVPLTPRAQATAAPTVAPFADITKPA